MDKVFMITRTDNGQDYNSLEAWATESEGLRRMNQIVGAEVAKIKEGNAKEGIETETWTESPKPWFVTIFDNDDVWCSYRLKPFDVQINAIEALADLVSEPEAEAV